MTTLVVSAHPDDETLGCGGTLLKYAANGEKIYWLIMTSAHEPKWSAKDIRTKSCEINQVAEAYGIEKCFRLGLPTARLDTISQEDLMQSIGDVIAETSPETVLMVHGGDIHSDHRITFTSAITVMKPAYMGRFGIKRILTYETLSSTEAGAVGREYPFEPNVFSIITPYIDRKVEIMNLYKSEAQIDPMPRGPSAIKALARLRGATIGAEYAEAFMMLRQID